MLILFGLHPVPITYQIVAILAAIAFFLPLLVVLLKKLGSYHPFIWLTLNWAAGGVVNLILMSNTIASNNGVVVIERVFNLASAPLMLLILYKSVQIDRIKISIRKMFPAFVCTLLALTLITRFQFYGEVLMVGLGLIIILVYLLWIIGHYIKGIKLHEVDHTLQFIYYALLFEYGISVITFVFSYIIPRQRDVDDSFLIYHLSIIISTSIASYGLFLYSTQSKKNKVVKKVKKIEKEAEITFL